MKFPHRRPAAAFACVMLLASCVVVSLGRSDASAATANTYISGKISGVTSGRLLAILPTGWSAYGTITRDSATGYGKFTIKLPNPKSTSTTLKASLHVVKSDGSYFGSISVGKKARSTSTYYSWYSTVTFPRGKTTTLPATISFSPTSKFGTLKLSRTSTLALTSPLVGATASSGKPKGAGRLGLASSRASTSSVRGVRTFAAGDTSAGEDYDGDGIPNSLDIDDDGDGFPDPVDRSSGNNSTSSSTRTAIYDVIGTLGSGLDNNATRVLSPINYNFLASKYSDTSELLKELSLLDDANFTLMVRAVAPFFTEGTQRIKAAWVECTGLAWCLANDSGDTLDSFVTAPRLYSWGDGRIGDIWKYAFTHQGGSQTPCNLYIPASNIAGDAPACKSVRWSTFTQKSYLEAAQTNGQSDISQSTLDWVAAQPVGTGFGLYDPWVLSTGSGPNSRGFDLFANVSPRGYNKFLQNLQVGDVFYINAILDDGTTSKIAMTVAPYFVTAPTVFSFQAAGDEVAESNTDKYVNGVTGCNNLGDTGCYYGSGRRPVLVDSSNPNLTVKFWRPQRQRVAETDGALGLPFLDMGGLNYRVSVQGGDGSGFYACPNTSVTFTDTNDSVFTSVPKGSNSNEREYMRDPSADATPSQSRYITLTIELNECSLEFAETPTLLNVNDTSTRFSVRLQADSEPKFGGNRSSAQQTFEIKFVNS